MRRAPSWAAATRRSAPTRRWARGPGLAFPRLPCTFSLPLDLPSSRLPRPAPPWWYGAAVRRTFPHRRPSCPITLSLLSPLPQPVSSRALLLSRSSSVRPPRILQALALERLLFPSFPVSSRCLSCFSRNRPRDLSYPDIFVPTFPILRAFIRNRMGESKQS